MRLYQILRPLLPQTRAKILPRRPVCQTVTPTRKGRAPLGVPPTSSVPLELQGRADGHPSKGLLRVPRNSEIRGGGRTNLLLGLYLRGCFPYNGICAFTGTGLWVLRLNFLKLGTLTWYSAVPGILAFKVIR